MSPNRVVVVDNSHVAELIGYNDTVIRVVEASFPDVFILVRGNEISLTGAKDKIDEAGAAIEELRGILAAGAPLDADVARETIRMLQGAREEVVPEPEPGEDLFPEHKLNAEFGGFAGPVPVPEGDTPNPIAVPERPNSAPETPVAVPERTNSSPETPDAAPEGAAEPEVSDLAAEGAAEPAESQAAPEVAAEPEVSETDPDPTPDPVAVPERTNSAPETPIAVPERTAAPSERPSQVLSRSVLSSRGRTIRPKTEGQAKYVDAIEQHTITFGIGPAGTGKTYLAMAQAVAALQAKRVNRIVLTRPAVEAGERLGFLPGSLSEKVDPYLRPLYDALHDMLDPESIPRLMEAGTIEVAPLAYMRGRTLNDAFVILDEAQNTTREQMKMFLTRLGFGATMVVTGDVTQVDLPGGTQSGLRAADDILNGVEDIAFCHLGAEDVVRHRLVSDIVTAYALADDTGATTASRRSLRTDGQQRRLNTNGDNP